MTKLIGIERRNGERNGLQLLNTANGLAIWKDGRYGNGVALAISGFGNASRLKKPALASMKRRRRRRRNMKC